MTVPIMISDEGRDPTGAGIEPAAMVNTIREELPSDFTLIPYQCRLPRPTVVATRLDPRIRQRRKHAIVQRRWLKNRGVVVHDIIDGKDPTAATTLPKGTVEIWTSLFSRPSPPIPVNIVGGDTNILGPVTIEEVRWLKKTTDRFSAPGPDELRATELSFKYQMRGYNRPIHKS